MNLKIEIHLNSRLLPILVGALLILEIAAPYDGWRVLLVGFGGAWLLAYLWVRTLSRSLELRREMRFGWAQVGDQLEEHFTLLNHGWVPGLWVEVIDCTNLPGYQISRATGVGPYGKIDWQTRAECSQRGLFTLGPTLIRSGDPLGIYTLELTDPAETQWIVTPPVLPLPAIEVTPGGRTGEGQPKPNALERTVSTAGVREYLPGDSPRWIHWRTTAHRGEPFVRLFDGIPSGDWWVVLDDDRTTYLGVGQESTEELGVILAASLVDRGLRLHKAVGLAVNGKELIWRPPQEGDGQRWEALRALAIAEPGERTLGEMLARMTPSFGRQASLILITANPDGAWVKNLLPLIWKGIVPTVLLLDPVTFGGGRSIQPNAQALNRLGVFHRIIPCGLLNPSKARPGRTGRWKWKISPTGRAIAVEQPADLSWRRLT